MSRFHLRNDFLQQFIFIPAFDRPIRVFEFRKYSSIINSSRQVYDNNWTVADQEIVWVGEVLFAKPIHISRNTLEPIWTHQSVWVFILFYRIVGLVYTKTIGIIISSSPFQQRHCLVVDCDLQISDIRMRQDVVAECDILDSRSTEKTCYPETYICLSTESKMFFDDSSFSVIVLPKWIRFLSRDQIVTNVGFAIVEAVCVPLKESGKWNQKSIVRFRKRNETMLGQYQRNLQG
jgi:hypothetical protein